MTVGAVRCAEASSSLPLLSPLLTTMLHALALNVNFAPMRADMRSLNSGRFYSTVHFMPADSGVAVIECLCVHLLSLAHAWYFEQ